MDEFLKELACFGCPYGDDCEDEWEDGHSHCDEMMNNAKVFVERISVGRSCPVRQLRFHENWEENT